MAEITAAAVKSLRDKTGLPMMKCKEALQATGGDEKRPSSGCARGHQDAGEPHRTRDRVRPHGRVYRLGQGVGAMVEFQCESAPVANSAEFIAVCQRPGQAIGPGPGATTADELLNSRAPGKPGRRSASRWTTCSTAFARCSSSAASCASTARAAAMPTTPATVGVLVEVDGRQRRSGQGRRHAHRGHASRESGQGRSRPGRGGQGARNPDRSGPQGRQAREHHRQDGRRADEELFRRAGAARAAVRQGRQATVGEVAEGPR